MYAVVATCYSNRELYMLEHDTLALALEDYIWCRNDAEFDKVHLSWVD